MKLGQGQACNDLVTCAAAWRSDLIQGKADRLHVQALFSQLAPVLLHQGDDHAAQVIVVVIGILQGQLELGVSPKCI